MSYFDDASLVMIPSGYKTSKVYSVKPTDGTGDLAFTRSNDTATRVGPDGLIEKVRTNLILQSETFDNASWTKSNATITANSIANPVNGATTAETLTFTGAAAAKYLLQSNTISGSYSQSVYFKYSTHQWMQLFQSGDGAFSANFDIQNGVLGSYNGCTPSIVSVGSGWYRCTITFASTTATQFVIWAIDSGTDARATNSASTGSVYIFGAQMEVSDFGATPYIATTTAAVSVGPVANVPRLDYLNSSCPRLLLEPQRTNLITFSEQLNNAGWSGGVATAVANQAASPDGYTNADLIYPTASGTFTGKYQNIAASTTGVVSCYVKQAGKRFAQLGTDNNATYTCAFDLQLGTIVRTATNYTATITNVGNGWFRITAAYVSSAAASYPFIGVSDNSAGGVVTDGTNGLYVYGFQYETSASYATSYIPTLGAAVTRSADAAVKTGISALIGQTEGTLFVEMNNVQELDFPEITIDDNTNNNRIVLTRNAVNGFWGIFTASAGTGASSYGTTAGNSGKFALAYSSAGYVLYRNGVQVATATASLPVSLSVVRLNGRATSDLFGNKNVAQTLLFKTRLSNAALAELTA